MPNLLIEKPDSSEHAPYHSTYIDLVPPGDLMGIFRSQIEGTLATLRGVSDTDSLRRYQDGKWSLREVIGHMIDAERIFAYRALRFARNDRTPLPGFDQDPYIPPAHFDARPWRGLIDEFALVRRGNLQMFEGFDAEAWQRRGVASGQEVSVRAVAYILAGHELHHMRIVRERYLGGS